MYENDQDEVAPLLGLGTSHGDYTDTQRLTDDAHTGSKRPQYIAALSATLGALAAGAMLGWSSPVGPQIVNGQGYNFTVTPSDNAWISSLVNLGAATICFPIGLIMDRIGRKPTMLFLVIPFTIGWVLIIWASNVSMLMVGRFITGMAGGAFCVTAPAYASEIAQDSIRGSLGSYFQLMVSIGILFAYVVGACTSVFLLSLLCALIPIVFGVVFCFMPESPNYLVIKGKHEEARAALIRLRSREYDVDDELNYLIGKADYTKNNPVSFRTAIFKKAAMKATIICYSLMIFQQLSGVNAVIFNTNTIFNRSGTSIDPAVATIIIGLIQVIATFASSLIVDKLGRRILLLWSTVVMCVCLGSLGIFFSFSEAYGKDSAIVHAISWLPLVSLSLFFVAFSIGIGPIPWMLAGELSTLGALAAGAMLGWSAPVGPKITNGTEYNFQVNTSENAWIGSLVNLGAAAVCFPIGLVMDCIGRRRTMLLLVLPFTIGWALIIWASNVSMLMVGRFITGMAGGAFYVTTPAYISEIAQDSIRGTLGTYYQFMVTIGILFAYVVGAYTSVYLFSLLCALLPVTFGVVFFFMPESPSYLVIKGKYEQARDALIRLRGPAYDIDRELNHLKSKADSANNNPVSFRTTILKKTAIKAIIICYSLMFFQQLSGINAVIFNTNTIFASTGSSVDPIKATIIIGVIQMVATFTSSLIVDKLGRRILLLFSALVMCLCLGSLGVFFFMKEAHGKDSAITWLPVVALSLFIVAFSIGFGPIPWIIAGEVCLIEIKAFVSSTAGTFNWLLSFAVTSTFKDMSNWIGDAHVFWIFGGFMIVAFIFTLIYVPETKGKSLEEIQAVLNGTPATHSRTVAQ